MTTVDLGHGVSAEIDGDEIALSDEVTGDTVTIELDAFDKLAEAVTQHRSSR